MVLVISN